MTRALYLLIPVSLGILTGLGGYTFFYAQGHSYLLDDPKACMNCHVMRSRYDSWVRSSHHAAATCNGCHTPHDLIGKYATKAINGWNHSAAFTTGDFAEPIRIHGLNAGIAHDNCVRCHKDMVSKMRAYGYPDKVDCVRCHGNVGHGERF